MHHIFFQHLHFLKKYTNPPPLSMALFNVFLLGVVLLIYLYIPLQALLISANFPSLAIFFLSL
ncbi:unnamed protein product [Meloidogyne enterolobii]|uniref:Uncharacterized protein n=2 Tax=Meloidogyne enterolobii TaxID=390850 RepID=A0A6V7VXD0_MELEN|nr:unnamed protein product [Meloidogyne enterolobii]